MGNKRSPQTNKARERRIYQEIVVDCYSQEEQMSGWWQYLADTLKFPFAAKCVEKQSLSPLKNGEVAEAVAMGKFADCQGNMFVIVNWQGSKLGAPLSQLEPVKSDKKTKQAIEDWKYWLHY